ncbi:hypothetical protein QN277_017260 [Acacia crassicarpa]|uniref:Uncharacterized protein n=2 Tax=Acacia crassicarpa TaxID=499986 RepID=A0AAE1JT80_9FABA|nr:hypothetical protein QN277_017260 [Acacia crassicarpa]
MWKAIKICWWWWMSALAVMAFAAAQSLPGCLQKCGQVEIPYPFGVGVQSGTGNNNCFFQEAFQMDCRNSTLFHGNAEISSISLKGQMDMCMPVSRICFNDTGGEIGKISVSLSTPGFTISSSENKFVSVGCDTYGYLNSFQNSHTYSTGCLTRCYGVPSYQQDDGTCSGIGCCRVDIPLGMRNISIEAFSFNSQQKASDFNNCSYAFVAKEGWFNFSTADLRSLPFDKALLVVDWAISDGTCENERTSQDYACKSNTHCEDSGYGFGYRCICEPGFEGNPYLPEGCRDIDECKESTHDCTSEDNCRNTVGSYECFCPRGYTGTGTKGTGCHPPWRHNSLTILHIVASVGLIVLFVSVAWLYLIYQKRKLMKEKEKFFRQNGGDILQQKLSVKQDSSLTAKIFTAQELKRATNNFHDSLVIGQGGFGTVYKGILPDNTVVAIKKSKLMEQSQIEQFINEVMILSQINHRNVVKLLGCCLETEVPLLVYEFVNNGTLFESIHNKSKACAFTWETRLRIAAEVAGALSYLHSAASTPIILRDVKSANILLDKTLTAKVSDFGASRLMPLDQVELATMVQGTFGYLDPEYMQTNQLTEKSDVYSFGVVVLELLTGRKAVSFDGPEEERSLAMHFLSSLNESRLFELVERGMVNDENEKTLKEVAELAAKCLRLKGEERPSMKEVAMELEGIRMTGKHPWINKHFNNAAESHSLLPQQTSRLTESVDSIVYRNTAWDSITDGVPIDLDDGR